MASVTISIPNIGNVVAENAATEETLLKLLKAMEKISGSSGSGDTKKIQDDLNKSKKEESDLTKKQNKSTTDLTKEQSKAAESAEKLNEKFKESVTSLGGFIGNVGKAAISLTAQFATAYQSIANNPIGAAAGIINTGIDLVNQGAKVGTSFLSMIPILGTGFKQAADAAADLAASLAKVANDIMAAEFKKSVAQLAQYTKAGASFAGGMIEMRDIAHQSGVSMEIMSKAALAASGDIRMMGLTQGEGVKAVGGAMKALATTTSSSGRALRDELLAMGYSYEEQGTLAAQLMANQRAAGITRKMSDEELAQTTRTYAKDLKVLADITGKDAKKAMEEAQKKSMEADILARLTPEEAEKFQRAYAAMPDYAKKGFLQYVSSGGTAITDQATNIAMTQNKEMETLIKGTYDSIKDPSQKLADMQQNVFDQTARVSTEQERLAKNGGAVIGMVNTLTGGMSETAKMQNEMIATGRTGVGAAAKSADAADKQASATDGVTDGYIKVTAAGIKLATTMEDLASKYLPNYADLLGTTMLKAVEAFESLTKRIKGGTTTEPTAPPERGTEGTAPLETTEGGAATGARLNVKRKKTTAAAGAMGGIFDGPASGYPVIMHGLEAIVPLSADIGSKIGELPDKFKDGGAEEAMATIAQTFKSIVPQATSGGESGINGLMQSLLDKQDEILRVMTDNRDYTQQLMHNLT